MTVTDSALKLFCNDLQAYCKVNLQIPIKGDEFRPPQMVPFEFNRSQEIVHEVLKDQWGRTKRIRAIILKSRQQGMSTYTAARFFRKLHLWPNHNAVVVADKDARSEVLFGMYDTYAHWLPQEMKPMMRWVSKKQEMFFDNPKDALRAEHPGLQSGITAETAGDVDAGRSKTIHLAHLTEVSMWPNAFEVFNSLINAVPDFGSEVIVESTARGVGNFFHRMWEAAASGDGVVEGENGFIAIFIPWWIHEEYRMKKKMTKKERSEFRATCDEYEEKCLTEGFDYRGENHKLVEEQLAWRRWTIAEKSQGDQRQFEQEYPATPEEAFLASGSNFFGESYLKKYLLGVKRPERREVIELKTPSGIGVTTIKVGQGRLRVWEMPRRADWDKDDPGGRYVIGADTAEGKAVAASASTFDDPDREKGGRDFCSADVVDVFARRVVASLHARMHPEEFARQLNMLGRFFASDERSGLRRPALLAPERNHSSGATVVKYLKDRYNYPNLFRHQQIAQRMDRTGEKYGFITSVETRRPMLDNLAAHIHERDNNWLPSREHVKEMLTFVIDDAGKPQAQEGAHDDRVLSLAITLFVLEIHAWHVSKNDDVTDLVEVGTSPTGWSTY